MSILLLSTHRVIQQSGSAVPPARAATPADEGPAVEKAPFWARVTLMAGASTLLWMICIAGAVKIIHI